MNQQQMRWVWGGASDIGGRNEQQDRWDVLDLRENGLLAVVADGMGGHEDGALGAQTAVETAMHFAQTEPVHFSRQPQETLQRLCQEAQRILIERSTAAHSTLVVVWLYQETAHWLHIGDSRCYHFRNGRRLTRTRDHSAVQMLVDLGEISEAEMGTHPDQNRLYRSLGGDELPKPDLGGAHLQVGDVLVLCSDGVWEYTTDQELWQCAQSSRLERSSQQLIKTAIRRAGRRADNATLVVLRCIDGQQRSWLQRLSGR